MIPPVDRPMVGLMLPSIPHFEDGRIEKRRIIDTARRAEEAGFDSIYIGDHLLHPNPLHEAVVTLSMVAAVTERVSIGTCVMLIALRDPLWLAKQLGTLENFAPGRLRVGVGVGGAYPGEFDIVDVPLPARGRKTAEVVQQVREAFSGSLPAFEDGGVEVGMRPVPRQHVPFLFAGRAEVPLRRAAEIGDGWIGYLVSPEVFAADRQTLLAMHKPGATAFSCGMLLHVQPHHQLDGAHDLALEGWRRITGQKGRRIRDHEKLFVAGPTDHIVRQLRDFWDAGCTEIVLAPADQGEAYSDQVDYLAAEILPRVKDFRAEPVA